ncbi:MAG TPA: Ig-like domain repeat protein [Bryobacteraceae bacterium]|nr:Ig-like domain repeat protein [Bryobacteraceae bacterium]
MFRLSCSCGIFALLVVLASPCAAQTTFNNSAPITINTSGGPEPIYAAPSDIAVSGLSGTVTDVTVTLRNINDDFDLWTTTVLLTGPGGRKLVLVSKAGYADLGPLTNSTLILSDSAGSLIPRTWASPPNNTTVTHRPTAYDVPVLWMPGGVNVCGGACPLPATQGSNTLLGTFGGIDPNGTWSLGVRLESGVEVLTIAGGWSITLTVAASAAPTTTTLTSSQTPSYTTNPVTFTASVASGGNPVSGQGAITFKDGSTLLSGPTPIDASGQATYTTPALTERTHAITAEYSGTSTYAPSSGSVTQIVKRHATIDGNRFCNPTAITIPESGKTGNQPTGDAASPYPSYMDVNLPGVISKLTVSLNGLSHGSISDVDMMLVSPMGQKFVLWSDIGTQAPVNSLNLVLDDTAVSALPDFSNPASGTYRPTSYPGSYTDQFPIPASGVFSWPAPEGSATLATFNGISPIGEWALYVMDQRLGNAGSLAGGWCLDFALATPDLTIAKSHTGNFRQGGTGTYTLTVTNSGGGPTSGAVTVTDTPPAGLTVTNMSGTGWICDTPARTCTRSDALAASASYPAITVAVDVASTQLPTSPIPPRSPEVETSRPPTTAPVTPPPLTWSLT